MILPGEKLPPVRVKGSIIKNIMTIFATPKIKATEVARITPPLNTW